MTTTNIQTLLTLRGLPASGKSTWAENHIKNNKGWKRVNKDLLREMLDAGVWSKSNEAVVIDTRDILVRNWLMHGYSVVVDDTNFSTKHITRLKQIAEEVAITMDKKIVVEEKFFDIPLKEAIDRDSKRGKKAVGKKVITDMFYKYLAGEKKERAYVPGLPEVVIVDIDGTIANSTGIRSPYDNTKYSLDKPIEKIIRLVKILQERYKIIFVSGREDIGTAREDTLTWLRRYVTDTFRMGDESPVLLQRAFGDQRKDFVVKKEIYERDIFPKYNVYLVLDDRSRVVNTLREELGLTVLQCAPGDF